MIANYDMINTLGNLTSIACKIMDHFLRDSNQLHLARNNLLNVFQYEFMVDRSPSMILLCTEENFSSLLHGWVFMSAWCKSDFRFESIHWLCNGVFWSCVQGSIRGSPDVSYAESGFRHTISTNLFSNMNPMCRTGHLSSHVNKLERLERLAFLTQAWLVWVWL